MHSLKCMKLIHYKEIISTLNYSMKLGGCKSCKVSLILLHINPALQGAEL
jgi:hypothetical protein